MRKVIYPYNMGSESAKLLAQALDCRRIKHRGSTFRGSHRVLAINWGSSSLPLEVVKCVVLNQPHAVRRASDKIKTFEALDGHVPLPSFTTDWNVARAWFDAGLTVVGRATVTGSEGKGIVLMRNRPLRDHAVETEFTPRLPLYTKYFPKHEEYRVHVVKGQVIDYTQKKRRREGVPALVRNTANGYVFTREGVVLPQGMGDAAVKAVAKLGLDFGAVDVVYNKNDNRFVILEINTAPGIEGTTLTRYAQAFEGM